MRLSKICEAAWWDQLKRQSRAAQPSERTPKTPRKRALKYVPPKDVSHTISHSEKPGAEKEIPTEPQRQKAIQPTPEQIKQAILSYIENHPDLRREIALLIRDAYHEKSGQASNIKETINLKLEQLDQKPSVNSKVLDTIRQLLQLLTIEQLEDLLISL